jgi:nitrogen fixation-related uncharacterized protein
MLNKCLQAWCNREGVACSVVWNSQVKPTNFVVSMSSLSPFLGNNNTSKKGVQSINNHDHPILIAVLGEYILWWSQESERWSDEDDSNRFSSSQTEKSQSLSKRYSISDQVVRENLINYLLQ